MAVNRSSLEWLTFALKIDYCIFHSFVGVLLKDFYWFGLPVDPDAARRPPDDRITPTGSICRRSSPAERNGGRCNSSLESFKLKMIFKKIAELNSSIKLDTAKYETWILSLFEKIRDKWTNEETRDWQLTNRTNQRSSCANLSSPAVASFIHFAFICQWKETVCTQQSGWCSPFGGRTNRSVFRRQRATMED